MASDELVLEQLSFQHCLFGDLEIGEYDVKRVEAVMDEWYRGVKPYWNPFNTVTQLPRNFPGGYADWLPAGLGLFTIETSTGVYTAIYSRRAKEVEDGAATVSE